MFFSTVCAEKERFWRGSPENLRSKYFAAFRDRKTIPEIILVIRKEADKTKCHSYGQRLVDQLRPERDKAKRR